MHMPFVVWRRGLRRRCSMLGDGFGREGLFRCVDVRFLFVRLGVQKLRMLLSRLGLRG